MSNLRATDSREGLIVACVALTAFIFQFEVFVVSVSLPTIAQEFSATMSQVSFVVICYLLAASITFLPASRIAGRVGSRRIFLAGCAVALIGTTGSAMASSLWLLCVGRLLQGIGAGAMVALGYGMIPAWVSPQRTGWGFGWVSLSAAGGTIAGLPVGGLLASLATWRFIFLVTVPVLMALLALAWRILPVETATGSGGRPPDRIGAVAFAVCLGCTVLVISLGDELGWSSPPILWSVSGVVGGAGLLALSARRSGRIYVPLDVFKAPGLAAGLGVLFLFAMVSGAVQFLMPFYLKLCFGLSALMSSALLLAYPLAMSPTGFWAGRAADRLGSRPLVRRASVLGALATFAFCLTLNYPEAWLSVVFMSVWGVTCGLFFAPNNRYVMSCTEQSQGSEAGALLPIALNLGSLLGVSFFDTAFSSALPERAADVDALMSAGQSVMPAVLRGFSFAFGLATVGLGVCAWVVSRRYLAQ